MVMKRQVIEEKIELVRTYYDEDGAYVTVYDYPLVAKGSRKRGRNDYYLVVKNDPTSTLTKEEVLNSLKWWYEVILFNNPLA